MLITFGLLVAFLHFSSYLNDTVFFRVAAKVVKVLMAKLPVSFSVASASMFCFPAFSLTLFADTLPQIIYFPSFHLFLHIICYTTSMTAAIHRSSGSGRSLNFRIHHLLPPTFSFSPKCHDVKFQIETRETRKIGHSGYATSPTDGRQTCPKTG